MTPRILLYGKDARTDAIAEACALETPEIFACGEISNPGLVQKCREVHRVASLRNVGDLMEYARRVRPDFVIVGPEDPLEQGLADALEAEGIGCFGPRRALAQIETSKAWARELLSKHRIAGVPEHRTFESVAGLREYLAGLGGFVVKPDGLTGGKGVKLLGEHLHSVDEGFAYASGLVEQSGRVVIEERLEGEEFSLQSITDGDAVVHCPIVQDHKRAFAGDTGPNTGGMGSYSCADFSLPFLDAEDVAAARKINEAVVTALESETGVAFRGVLYGGFMATRDGVRVIEYNARFGDPEAMNVLPLLATSFVDLCRGVVDGRLHQVAVRFEPRATVCKYVVPRGYPENPERGEVIEVDARALSELGVRSYYAAVDTVDRRMVLTGSRALALVGIAGDLPEAERLAELATSAVRGPLRHRSDIGTDALLRSRIGHMRALRASRGDEKKGASGEAPSRL